MKLINLEEIDKAFKEMETEVRRISENQSFVYPQSYIEFYKQFLKAGKGTRDDGEWVVFMGKEFIRCEMESNKKYLGLTAVPIAMLRDSSMFAFISCDEKSSKGNECFETDHVFLMNPLGDKNADGSIPIFRDYTFPQFVELAMNDIDPFEFDPFE